MKTLKQFIEQSTSIDEEYLEEKNKPTNNYGDNFGSYKPITDGLIDNRPGVTQPKNINLPDKLKDTRLDNTIRKTFF